MTRRWHSGWQIVNPGWIILPAIALTTSAALRAEPTLRRVDPPGAQRGAAVRLVLDGNGLGDKVQIRSGIPGSMTELSADGPAREFLLEVDGTAAPGVYPLAVQTKDGLTNTWLFSVSGFPEAVEEEARARRVRQNDTAKDAQPIETPRVINGTLTEADRDLYAVSLEAGEPIVFEVEARRLGSAIDPVLAVWAPDGSLVARSNDSAGIGQDARVPVKAPVEGTYTVEVHDARFSKQGRNFYRLLAAPIEFAEEIFPLGWTMGEPAEVELSGGTLSRPRRVTVDGTTAALPGTRGGLPMPFLRGRDPETIESRSEKGRRLAGGTVVNGRISQAGEIDRYRLSVRPGEEWMIETQAAILGTSQLYTLLVVRDQEGRKLGSAGDQPPEELLSNISTRAETFGDPALGLTVPEGVSELEVSVEDLLGRGGGGFGYRLVARRQSGDFILRLDDTHVNVPRGGSAAVSVTLDRRGFEGAIRVVAEGLPDGVVAEGGNIPAEFGGMTTQRNSRKGRLILNAAADAEPTFSKVSFFGEGVTPDGRIIRRPALTSRIVTPVAGSGQRALRLPGIAGSIDAVVADPAPAEIKLLSPRSLRLIQGLERDIEWTYQARQSGVQVISPVQLVNAPSVANLRILGGAKIKAGDPKGTFEMNTTMGTPAMRFDLVLQARVRHQGVDRTIYSPAIAVDIVQGYSVGAPQQPVEVSAGAEFSIDGSFLREPDFDSTVIVEASNLPVGVHCDARTIADSPERYSLQCRAEPDVVEGKHLVEITPQSVLAGRGKEAVPYNIKPVEAILVISAGDTIATVQQTSRSRSQ